MRVDVLSGLERVLLRNPTFSSVTQKAHKYVWYFLPLDNTAKPSPEILISDRNIYEILRNHLCHIWELSNEVLYDFIPQGYQKYDRPKLKVQLLLSKFRLFNIDLSYFWCHLRCKVIQYLIGKLLKIVKMNQEGLVVEAFQHLSGHLEKCQIIT